MSLYEPEIKTVHLDRPFVYAIIDTETQMPIFLGVESVEEYECDSIMKKVV